MNWDTVSGNWKHLKGKAREAFGDLTDDDMEKIAGKKDQFVGTVQTKYGITRDEAEKRVDKWHTDASTHPDTRGLFEKVADAVTGDRVDDKTGKIVR